MMNRVRDIGQNIGRLVAVSVFLLATGLGNFAKAEPYIQVPNERQLLEHLYRHSDALLAETNLIKASNYYLAPAFAVKLVELGGWGAAFLTALTTDPVGFDPMTGKKLPLDSTLARLMHQFRIESLRLVEVWNRHLRNCDAAPEDHVAGRPCPAFLNQFRNVNRAYHNALAATYLYLEGVRTTYVIREAFTPVQDPQLALKMAKLEAVAYQLRELMHVIRVAAPFQLPVTGGCFECSFAGWRMPVLARTGIQLPQIPFFLNQQFWVPKEIPFLPHAEAFRPGYDVVAFETRWNYVDTVPVIAPGVIEIGPMPGDGASQPLPQAGAVNQPAVITSQPANPGSNPPGTVGQVGQGQASQAGPPPLPVGNSQTQPGNGDQPLPQADGSQYGPQPLPGNNGGGNSQASPQVQNGQAAQGNSAGQAGAVPPPPQPMGNYGTAQPQVYGTLQAAASNQGNQVTGQANGGYANGQGSPAAQSGQYPNNGYQGQANPNGQVGQQRTTDSRYYQGTNANQRQSVPNASQVNPQRQAPYTGNVYNGYTNQAGRNVPRTTQPAAPQSSQAPQSVMVPGTVQYDYN